MVSQAVGIAFIILGLCAVLGVLLYLGKGQVQSYAQHLYDYKTKGRQQQRQPEPEPERPEAAPSEAATAGA